jgi:MFS family permease
MNSFESQVSVITLGVIIMLLPVIDNWGLLLLCVIGLGIAEGGLVPLMGKIATELCGPQAVPQALGFLFGLFFIPVTIGPAVAGNTMIYMYK